MTTEQKQALADVLLGIIGGLYREMGGQWCEQMAKLVEVIKKPPSHPPFIEYKPTFHADENGTCIHCGEKSGLHLYANKRCRNSIPERKPRKQKH